MAGPDEVKEETSQDTLLTPATRARLKERARRPLQRPNTIVLPYSPVR